MENGTVSETTRKIDFAGVNGVEVVQTAEAPTEVRTTISPVSFWESDKITVILQVINLVLLLYLITKVK